MKIEETAQIQTTILQEYNLAVMYAFGLVTDDDFKKNLDSLLKDKDFKINMDSLILFDEAKVVFSIQKLMQFAEYMELNKHKRGDSYRIAFVSSQSETIARAKLFKTLSKAKQYRFQQFETVEAATDWLINKSLSVDELLKLTSTES